MKNLKQFNEFINESSSNENTHIEINDREDFLRHYEEVYGSREQIQNILSDTFQYNFENKRNKRESENIAVENFYENTILQDEEEGFIKLNISKEEVLEILLDILTI